MIIAKASINLHMAVCSVCTERAKINKDSNQSAHSNSLIGLDTLLTSEESLDTNINPKLPSEYSNQSARVRMLI